MGLWVPRPSFSHGEQIIWSKLANREQTPLRQVGGRLFLTSHRLVFRASRFERVTGGEDWSCASKELRGVDIEEAAVVAPILGRAAKLRRRLRVTTVEGGTEIFVVNGLDRAVVVLRAALT